MKECWNRLKMKVMSISLSKKVLAIISLLICFLMFAWVSLLTILSSHFSRNEQLVQARSALQSIAHVVSQNMFNLRNTAETYSLMPEVQNLLIQSNLGHPQYITSRLLRLARSNPHIIGLAFYNKQGAIIDYISLDVAYDPVPQVNVDGVERPFVRIISGNRDMEWEYIDATEPVYMYNERTPKLCLWYGVRNTKTRNMDGVMAISLSSERLFEGNYAYIQPQYSYLILDSKGRLVTNSMSVSPKAQTLNSLYHQNVLEKNYYNLMIDGKNFYSISMPLKDCDLRLYCLVPESSRHWERAILSFSTISALFIFIGTLLPAYYLLTRFITRPLIKLNNSLKRFSQGDYSSDLQLKYNDEIGQLGDTFNEMIREKKQLIETSHILKLRQKEAELKALQSQINPHFIYNLISSIQWNAYRKGDEEIAEMAYSMGQIFRISLSEGKNIISVRQERDLITAYLNLQKKRFGSLIEYQLDFPENTLELQIPKFIIQPLVENTIVHGIESKDSVVHIKVEVSTRNHRVFIYVCDDGKGIAPNILKDLPANLVREGPTSSFAIKNIYERLQLTFGKDFTFLINSKLHHGVEIRIEFPILDIQKKEDLS